MRQSRPARERIVSRVREDGVISPEQVVLALYIGGIGSKSEREISIAEKLGVDQKTISRIISEWRVDGLNNFKVHVGNLINLKLQMLLESLTLEKIRVMNGRDIAWTFGVLYDKKRLEEGKPTQIKSWEKLSKEEESLVNQIKAWDEKAGAEKRVH